MAPSNGPNEEEGIFYPKNHEEMDNEILDGPNEEEKEESHDPDEEELDEDVEEFEDDEEDEDE